MGAAHEIIALDVTRSGGQVDIHAQIVEKPLGENHQPLNGIPIRTYWSRKTPPDDCFELSHGVLYVQKEPGIDHAPPPEPVNAALGADGTQSYPYQFHHLDGGIAYPR